MSNLPTAWAGLLLTMASVAGAAPEGEGEGASRGEAISLEAGDHLWSELGADTWYALEVPAGSRLRVVAEFQRAGTSSGLFLESLAEERLASSWGSGDRQELLLEEGAERVVRLCVHSRERVLYKLLVRFERLVSETQSGPHRYEPNDSPWGVAVVGPGRWEGVAVEGVDFFVVDVPEGQQVVVEVDGRGEGAFELFADASAGGPGVRWSSGTTQMLRWGRGEGAPLVFGVYGEGGAAYDLELRLEPYQAADRFEPNDTPERAGVLGPGRYEDLALEGRDHYEVVVPEGSSLRVVLTRRSWEGESGELDAMLVEPRAAGWRILREAHDIGDAAELVWGPGTGGPVQLRVWGEWGQRYALELEFLAYQGADRFEPNDTARDAAPLSPGTYRGLVLSDFDHYAVTVPAGCALRARLAVEPGEGSVNFGMASGELDRLALWRIPRDQPSLLWGPGEGTTALFHVHGDEGTGYTLIIEEHAPIDLYEPNDTPADASALEPGRYSGLVSWKGDVYRVALAEGEELLVELRGEQAEWLSLDLSQDGWEVVRSAHEDGEVKVLRWGPGSGDDVYLTVSSLDGALYELEIQRRVWGPADLFEPNDTPETAALLAPGEYPELELVGGDFYTIEVEVGQTVEVLVSPADPERAPSVTLVGAHGGILDSTEGDFGQQRVRWTVEEPGPLRLLVYGLPTKYSLRLTVE